MRSVPMQGKTPPFKNAKDRACRYYLQRRRYLIALELLDQQLTWRLPVGIISRAIITTDNYLGYSPSHYYFFRENVPAAFRFRH